MSRPKQNTVLFCTELALPVIEELGLILWDVRFEKEGSGWFLRYFIDKENGLVIEDCENFSRAIDPLLDQADPIEQSYCLEVSSPGIQRDLIKPWHFDRYIGHSIAIRLFRAKDGIKEYKGKLLSYLDGIITIAQHEKPIIIQQSDAAYVRLADDYDDKGEKQ